MTLLLACAGSEPESAVIDESPSVPATPNTNAAVSAEGPATCEALADAKPAGTLTIIAMPSEYDLAAIDAYASIADDGSLAIVLTETAQTCAYRAHGLVPHIAREMRVGAANAAVDAIDLTQEESCASGGGGHATRPVLGRERVRGTLTITTRTATEVAGALDVVDADARRTSITFRAPICPTPPAAPSCCF